MQDRFAKISFLATGHVIQDVLITNPNISAGRLQVMLEDGSAVTTVQEGQHVCVTTGDWEPIGKVVYVEAELDYKSFILEDAYVLPTPKQETFNASRVALAGAIGDYIDEPDKTVDKVLAELERAGGSEPQLVVTEQYSGLSGNQLLKEIRLTEQGFMSLMEIAYNACKLGQEMV
jgi:dipeptidyl aminopeptidase/acylaminoacyl peptidase